MIAAAGGDRPCAPAPLRTHAHGNAPPAPAPPCRRHDFIDAWVDAAEDVWKEDGNENFRCGVGFTMHVTR